MALVPVGSIVIMSGVEDNLLLYDDVPIYDFNETTVQSIVAPLLDCPYLSNSLEDKLFPIDGTFAPGLHRRLFVCLAVRHKRKFDIRGPRKNVIFLIDTGSKNSYLTAHAFNALGLNETPSFTTMDINGFLTSVLPSGDSFLGINLLGQDLFAQNHLELNINYRCETVVITSPLACVSLPSESDDGL